MTLTSGLAARDVPRTRHVLFTVCACRANVAQDRPEYSSLVQHSCANTLPVSCRGGIARKLTAYGGDTDRPSGQAVREGSPPIAVAIQGSQQTFVPDQLGNMLWFSTILEIFRFYVHMRP